MLSTTLPDLKGALCGGFCDSRVAFISAVLSVDPQQRQGPENGQVRASGIKAALNAPISCSVSQHPVPRGAEDCESGCGFSSPVMPDLRAFNFGGKIGVEE